MKMERLSERLLLTLRQEASSTLKSDIRLATLTRLESACNALEDGTASALLFGTGKPKSPAMELAISATNIERYVLTMRRTDPTWIGPKRVTIQKDADLRRYVQAREDERKKDPRVLRRPSDRQKETEDVLNRLADPADRALIREMLAAGARHKRELDLITKTMKKIDIDLEALLQGRAAVQNGLTEQDRFRLCQLVERLSDPYQLALLGLRIDDHHVYQEGDFGSTLVERDEMLALMSAAGVRK